MFTTPLVGERLRLGLELQYLGQRLKYDGQHLPSTTVAHITLTSRNWWPHWQFSLSVRNAFNRKYEDVLASGVG
jgi:outer membrane receptor protein involved in Fe transport